VAGMMAQMRKILLENGRSGRICSSSCEPLKSARFLNVTFLFVYSAYVPASTFQSTSPFYSWTAAAPRAQKIEDLQFNGSGR